MVRSSLIAAGAALLCGVSFAQQVDNVYPITAPIQRGPVINMRTGQPLSPAREAQLRVVTNFIYDNTCTWSGGGFYTATGACEDYIDEGRIPGGIGGNNPAGSSVDNNVTFFEIGYCTNFATGQVDIKIGFYDSLGGQCTNTNPVPPSLASQAVYYAQLPVATMPGDATPGGTGVACWTVGFDLGNVGFCMQSDGDGIFDNIADQDRFNWSFQMDNVIVSGTAASGIILSGDPFTTTPGSCTYNIPCSTDAFGAVCGTGLDNSDDFWINVDNDPPAGGNTGSTCVGAPSGGTACYWFGGAPGNPFGGFYMLMGSNGSCGGCVAQATTYCTAGTTTNGCNATMALQSGIPSASNAGPAIVAATNVEGNKQGVIFYGIAQSATPWSPTSTSFLCVKSPTQRTASQGSGGTTNLCDGTIAVDINAELASQTTFPVAAGNVFDIQAWFRDPPAPKTTNLSNALEITLCP